MTLAFILASIFWIIAPIAFLIGRLCGLWNFHRDILIFSVLMGLCFLVCLAHIAIGLLRFKNETWEAEKVKKKMVRMLNRRMNKS